jgi:[ribosomal protein S5]-alanine N-acetyltransferase
VSDYIIVTERLGLRRFTLSDVDALHDVFSDSYARRFFPSMSRRPAVERWIRRDLERYDTLGFGLWAMCLRHNGQLIGGCGLTHQEVEGKTELELGFHVRADMRQQGFATEAARACMQFGFQGMACKRIVCMVHPDNFPSLALAKRVFHKSRRFRRRGRAYYLYSTKRKQWQEEPGVSESCKGKPAGQSAGSQPAPHKEAPMACKSRRRGGDRKATDDRTRNARSRSSKRGRPPRVSVVMPTHNYARYIGEAIDGVLAQTCEDFELIIVDDASTDNTLDIVTGYRDDRIVLVQREDCTCSGVAAINDGMAIARADLIAVADSDDISVPERLERQATFLDRNPTVDFLGGGLLPVDGRNEPIGRPVMKPVYRKRPERYRQALLQGVPVLIQGTMMHRRHVLERLGGYGGYISSGDTEFLLRASRYYTFCNLRSVLIRCRQHRSSVTRQSGARLKKLHHRIFLEKEHMWVQKELERMRMDPQG